MKVKVFVIAIGDISYKKYSLEILNDFFSKQEDMDLFILEDQGLLNTKNTHPSWLKLISHKYLDTKDMILCWDLDLLPKSKNSKFDLSKLSNDNINLCYDTSVILNQPKFNQNFYFNLGLIGIPKCKRDILEHIYNKYGPIAAYPSYEQYYVNDFIQENKEPINILPPSYNTLHHDGELFYSAEFQHYTWQCLFRGNRDELIKQHYNEYFKN